VSFQKLQRRQLQLEQGGQDHKRMGGRWSVDKDVESVKNHPENVRYFWLCGNDDRWDTGEWHQPKGDSLWLASLSMLFQIPPIISSPKSQFLQIKLLLPFSLQWRLAMSHKWYEKHKRFRSAKLSWVCQSSNCCQDPDGRMDVSGALAWEIGNAASNWTEDFLRFSQLLKRE